MIDNDIGITDRIIWIHGVLSRGNGGRRFDPGQYF